MALNQCRDFLRKYPKMKVVESEDTALSIKQIAMQKWVANANYQHVESFLERNRTKYPAVNTIDIRKDRADAFTNFPKGVLTIAIEGRGKLNAKLPSSPIYPQSVLTRNENAPVQKQNLLENVWWNTKAE